jgi:exonuclease SbcC
MPKIKIGKVKIENFRLFTSMSQGFDGANIIVFDGPNGFGKTSFYRLD